MVKLDNWETKAEKAAERRVRSRELKQQKQQTRHHKALAQQLLKFLQDHNDAILRSSGEPEIHLDLWVDAQAVSTSASYSAEDDLDSSGDSHSKITMLKEERSTGPGTRRKTKGQGRARANSYEMIPEATVTAPSPRTRTRQQSGRPRSDSDASTYGTSSSSSGKYSGEKVRENGKKGGRPHRGSSGSDSAATNHRMPRLCRAYFFFGTCPAPRITPPYEPHRGRRRGHTSGHPSTVAQCASGWHGLVASADGASASLPTKKNAPREGQSSGTTGIMASVMIGVQKKEGPMRPDHWEASQRESLQASSKGAESFFRTTQEDETGGAMDMLCHDRLSISGRIKDDERNGVHPHLVEALSSLLTQNNWPIGSISYVVMKDMLVFDRYRGGLVLSDVEQELLLFGGSKRRSIASPGDSCGKRRNRSDSLPEHSAASHYCGHYSNIAHNAGSLGDSTSHNDTEDATLIVEEDMHSLHQRLVQHLPGQVLEYILSFLPVSATAILPQVCPAWNHEIGRSSPNLWRNLLTRYKWSCPVDDEESVSLEQKTAIYRDMFVSHYKASRDLRAIKFGLDHLLSRLSASNSCFNIRNGRSTNNKDVASFNFQDTIGTPIVGNTMVQVWSETRALVGSSRDCTLHLYDIVDHSSGSGKRCKQSIRVKVVPFANTRKRPYELTAMELDKSNIACLFKESQIAGPGVWLVVLKREDLLCSGKGGNHVSCLAGNDVAQTFDLQKEVLRCISASNDSEVISWLEDHALKQNTLEDAEDLFVTIEANRLVACEDGLFLVEAYLSLTPDFFDNHPRMLRSTLGKIFLFSSIMGRIVWTSPQNCDLDCASLDKISNTDSINGCFTSSLSRIVAIAVKGPCEVACVEATSPPLIQSFDRQLVAMTPSEVLLVDQNRRAVQVRGDSATSAEILFRSVNRESGIVCLLDGGLFEGELLAPILALKQDYLVVFCASNAAQVNFLVPTPYLARLFHIPSRQVIHETVMEVPYVCTRRLSFACNGGSVAISFSDVGMFFAGHGVSHTSNDTWENQKKGRKKKWIRGKGKRDGFARGMRQSMG